jgi:uncharacterized phage protein gp47/JayE
VSDLQPAISYSSKDYASFRRLMLDVKKSRVPEWQGEDSASDLGVAIIESVAYMGDILSFYGDRIANEAFLETATSRRAILDIARMLDYRPSGVIAARVSLEFTLRADTTEPVTIPAGTAVTTRSFTAVSTGSVPVQFETAEELVIDPGESLTGAVDAYEGLTITDELVAVSDGSMDQRYPTFRKPVIHDTIRVFVDEGSGFTEWTYFHRLIDALSNQFAFTTEEREDGSLVVIFGDGINGRMPSEGSPIRATYRVGGGDDGNVGANTLVEMQNTIMEVDSVTNPLPATGGAEPESIDQIRINAPRALRALTRAVSLQDYASLALQVPGISKARSVSPLYDTVIVYVAPYGGGPAPDILRDEVEEYFEERKLVTHNVVIENATYVDIQISATAVVKREFNRTAVQREVEAALVSMLGFDRVDFGHLVALSHVYDTINNVEGVSYATVTVLSTSASGVDNLQLAPEEIPVVGTIEVTATEGIPGT